MQKKAVIAGAILCVGVLSGGIMIQSGAWREASAAPPASVRLLEEVMARIRRDFIDTVSTEEMYRRAAEGFVKEIEDPHSALLTPDRYRRLRETTSGKYAGVGVELDIRDGFVTVIAPLSGTPADSAGIEPGDRILTIDGKPAVNLTMEEVERTLRGPPGSTVRLGIERWDGTTPSFTLRRRQIVYHPVQKAIIAVGGIGYLELATFSESAAREVRRTVDSLRKAGARSLILDLRENPGGLLEQGIAVADLFIDAGKVIASTRGRVVDATEDFRDAAAQPWPNLPVVVLVDSGSASASEIVAGALQDHGRAVILGSPTYGKGSAQSIFPVIGGRALKLTTARWFTPKGRTIERDSTNGGITPDILVRKDQRIATAETHAPTSVPYPPSAGDPAIARALQLLDGVGTIDELKARARTMAKK
jgi:carboxyl-terminal processing protease